MVHSEVRTEMDGQGHGHWPDDYSLFGLSEAAKSSSLLVMNSPPSAFHRLTRTPLPLGSCGTVTWFWGKSFSLLWSMWSGTPLLYLFFLFFCDDMLDQMEEKDLDTPGVSLLFYDINKSLVKNEIQSRACDKVPTWSQRGSRLPQSPSLAYLISGGGFWNSQEIPIWRASSSYTSYYLSVSKVAHIMLGK